MPNQAQNIDQLNKQIKELREQLGKEQLTPFDVNDIKKAREALRGLQADAAEINTTFSDLTSILKANLAEMSKQNSALNVSKKGYQGLTSVVEKLKNEEAGIYGFNAKQLKALQEKAKIGFDDLRRSVQALTAEERRSEVGQAMLKARRSGYALEKEALKEIEKRVLLEEKVEKTVGATGALLTSTNKLLGALGFGHLSSEIDELNTKLKDELREEIRKAGSDADTVSLKFKYMGKAAAGSARIFADGLMQPEFIIGKIFDTYLKINKASVDVQHLTGQNAVAAASWGANYASAVDYLETINALTVKTGMNAQNIFSEKVIGQAAALKTTMGLSADEAGGLATMSQTAGKNVNDVVDSVVATTSAFNGANRAAVSQGAVLREVANTSDSIKLSLGNNPEALAKAAAAATRLGLSLQDVDNIAASLTDFQSSISNELEAELLTGKDLNLEKARELALNNDLEGVSKELFKNSSDIAEFGKMNRIQQESYAKALGMTKDQLAKMAYNKALEAGMTEDQAAAAANVNAEDMKRVAAQENFAKALEKISGALAPILDIVGDILSMPLVPYLLLGAAAVGRMGIGLTGMLGSIKGVAAGAKDMVSNLSKGGIKGAVGGVKSMLGGKAESLAEQASPVGGKISELADKTKNVKAGTGVKDFLVNLGKGLEAIGKSLANGQVILGLAVLTGAIIGIGFALNLAAPGIEAFGKVVTAVFAGLGVIITAVADGFVKLLGAVSMENIGPMLLLGPALFGVAAGLAAIGVAGITAIPGIVGLTALAVIAPALTGLAGAMGMGGESKSAGEAKGKGGEGSLAAVEKKLDDLISAVKAGGNVYMDSNKVGRAQVLGSYKSA